jgi:hypothetical protein
MEGILNDFAARCCPMGPAIRVPAALQARADHPLQADWTRPVFAPFASQRILSRCTAGGMYYPLTTPARAQYPPSRLSRPNRMRPFATIAGRRSMPGIGPAFAGFASRVKIMQADLFGRASVEWIQVGRNGFSRNEARNIGPACRAPNAPMRHPVNKPGLSVGGLYRCVPTLMRARRASLSGEGQGLPE